MSNITIESETSSVTLDYKVADMSLAEWGRKEIDIADAKEKEIQAYPCG
mgnify:CR=1 FL=1